MTQIASLAYHEEAACIRVLARAFRDNPINRAVIGDDPARRLRCNLHGMRALLPVARRRGLTLAARLGHDPVGVLMATPPFLHPLPPPDLPARLRCVMGQGIGIARRWARVFRHLDAEHPQLPHWYLNTLGVDPAHQGRGAGGDLLGQLLARADAEGLPVYLETDRLENTRFYQARGFRVAGELEVLDVPVWLMWKPAIG